MTLETALAAPFPLPRYFMIHIMRIQLSLVLLEIYGVRNGYPGGLWIGDAGAEHILLGLNR